MKFKILNHIFASFIINCTFLLPISGAAIIFDLGEVLIHTQKIKAFRYLGIKNILWYLLTMRQNPEKIKKKVYEILEKEEIIQQFKISFGITPKNNCNAKDNTNELLPKIMCEWQCGTIPSTDMKNIIINEINTHPEWFKHASEHILTLNIIELIFTPEKLANSRKINATGIELIKQLKKDGHKVFVLSNWDRETIVILQEKHPEFFSLFDGLIFSGHHGYMKPHKKLYKKLFKLIKKDFGIKINRNECIFIDDQPDNIAMARNLGITGINHIPNDNFYSTSIKLSNLLTQKYSHKNRNEFTIIV